MPKFPTKATSASKKEIEKALATLWNIIERQNMACTSIEISQKTGEIDHENSMDGKECPVYETTASIIKPTGEEKQKKFIKHVSQDNECQITLWLKRSTSEETIAALENRFPNIKRITLEEQFEELYFGHGGRAMIFFVSDLYI